jgi:antitoxin ParD1/3/4
MPTREIDLDDRDDQLIERLVATGRYGNANEVMRAGLSLLEQRAREDEEKLRRLRDLAGESFASLDRGEGTTLEGNQALADFIGKLGRRAARREKSQRQGGE